MNEGQSSQKFSEAGLTLEGASVCPTRFQPPQRQPRIFLVVLHFWIFGGELPTGKKVLTESVQSALGSGPTLSLR